MSTERGHAVAEQANKVEIAFEQGRSVVRGQLGPEDEKRFATALFNYLRRGVKEWVLDFSQMHYMSSAYIGATCMFCHVVLQHAGHSVVILANEKVAKFMRVAGLDELVKLRIV